MAEKQVRCGTLGGLPHSGPVQRLVGLGAEGAPRPHQARDDSQHRHPCVLHTTKPEAPPSEHNPSSIIYHRPSSPTMGGILFPCMRSLLQPGEGHLDEIGTCNV